MNFRRALVAATILAIPVAASAQPVTGMVQSLYRGKAFDLFYLWRVPAIVGHHACHLSCLPPDILDHHVDHPVCRPSDFVSSLNHLLELHHDGKGDLRLIPPQVWEPDVAQCRRANSRSAATSCSNRSRPGQWSSKR